MSQLKSVSLFSGIGGISIGTPLLYVEKDFHCQRVLRARFADGSLRTAPIHGDITTLKKLPAGCDLLHAGFPCTNLSSAGLRAGVVNGAASGLFFEVARLASIARPQYVFFENVRNVRYLTESWKIILLTMHRIGYSMQWCECTAEMSGAPHKRARWFMLCTLAREADMTADLELTDTKMHACGELLNKNYSATAPIVGNPRPICITLLPLTGPKKCQSTNLVTKPIVRHRWATVRASGGNHGARGLTVRCSADLCTMLKFAKSTPDNQRWLDHCRPNADFIDTFMGFPKGWSNHDTALPTLEHTFVEDTNVPRLIRSTMWNSKRLKMLGSACCPQQAALAFSELWKRTHSLHVPLPEMLHFPKPTERSSARPSKRRRTDTMCPHCNGTGVKMYLRDISR